MTKREGRVGPRRRRGAIITLLVGIALIVLMPIVGVLGGLFSGIGGIIATSGPPVYVSPAPSVVEIKEGREFRLLAPVDVPSPDFSDCTVTPPPGGDVLLQIVPPTEHMQEQHDGTTYVAFARLIAVDDGEYVIDCSSADSPVIVSVDRMSPWTLPLIWILGGLLGGVIGAVLLIIGIVRLVRVNRHNREVRARNNPRMQNPVSKESRVSEPARDAEPKCGEDAVVANPLSAGATAPPDDQSPSEAASELPAGDDDEKPGASS